MKTLIAIIFSLFSLSAFADQLYPPQMPPQQTNVFPKKITLPAGTLIMLETNDQLKSDELTEGQLIHLKVTSNVYVKERMVIRQGAFALGRIKSISKSTYNNPGTVTLEVTSVQSVDSQLVNLRGNEQVYHGKYRGQGFTLKSGMSITATVMNDQKIKL